MTSDHCSLETVTVRRVTTDDAPIVANLVKALFNELRDGAMVPQYRSESISDVLAETERSFGLLALDGSRAIGVLMLTEAVAIFAGGIFGQITELYVMPDFRSQGVAAMLVKSAAELGRARGWKRMDVGAPHQPRWSRSLNFYRSEGFVEVGPRLRLDL
ncbi:hypothetical protein A6V36_27330 [Paraburkholderia ginsengiterrae]|uniref:N-acetyltransferase domain-containing protein n=1 Tax=Paraburkholderia ginsengiterrae TaxID=1462993 RepID=A0A1A9NAI0_9BURK|nr:GNAT family N-acetyltransferase [Paraburkholderia ginsengiterrae]OAJ59365.1 hypothetical protein A6V36_27330 [Paraburkholderia ginsengiterrae]OAJ63278.1 hypothetical protein A6V37_20475 [Paraburkholderia ginsengiterrae]